MKGKENLEGVIALRYLFGRKSHSAVNAIAWVSVCGIVVAAAAMVCVLSVFNGFSGVLGQSLHTFTPDIKVSPSEGKVFGGSSKLAARIEGCPGVKTVLPVLSEQALALSGNHELPVTLLGVEAEAYSKERGLDSLFFEGSDPLASPFSPYGPAPASLAVGTAIHLQTAGLGSHLMIFAPRREGRINLANPAASFRVDSVEVTSVYRSGQKEFDENVIITDIGRVRDLLQHEPGAATALEVSLKPDADPEKVKGEIRKIAGKGFTVKDRLEQQEVNFRMVRIEKYVTFLLLVFILVIASFNVISTLCMLVLEKEEGMKTLYSLGMSRKRVGKVFGWESLYVSIGGGLAGVGLGSVLCLLQEKFGFIKLNGDAETLLLTSYPVKLEWSDLGLTMLPVIAIGIVCALTASAFARRRLKMS